MGKYDRRTFLRVAPHLCLGRTVFSTNSVTRFGKISPIWQFFTVHFLIGKMLSLLWQICDIIGLVFIVANGQILKNNLAIGSHWVQTPIPVKILRNLRRPPSVTRRKSFITFGPRRSPTSRKACPWTTATTPSSTSSTDTVSMQLKKSPVSPFLVRLDQVKFYPWPL